MEARCKDGYDIVFIASDGSTLLNYEKEYYNATTGDAVFWIRTTEGISSTTDSTIYLYYGKSGSTDLSNTTATWGAATGSDPVAVWYMQNSTSTDAYQYDSTLNNNDDTFYNTDASGQKQGQIDGSFEFDGVNDCISVNNNAMPSGNTFTISFWFKLPVVGTHGFMGDYWNGFCIYLPDAEYLRLLVMDSTHGFDTVYDLVGGDIYPLSQWKYITYVADGTNLSLCANGVFVASSAKTAANISTPLLLVCLGGDMMEITT